MMALWRCCRQLAQNASTALTPMHGARLWKVSALALSISFSLPNCLQARQKPNIVFILADDLGWGDVGYHNPEIYSPNIDRLARQNIELDQYYATPQCTPTRVSFLTGRYAQRFGPQAVRAGYNVQAIPYETPTIASLLKSAGYDTALIGKWHLGSVPGQHPNLWGFDYSYGCLGGAVGLYIHRYSHKQFEHTWHRNGKLIPGSESGEPYEQGKHVTDLITKDAIRFLEEERGNPFFLYLAYTAVHTPLAEEEKWFKDPAGKIAKIENEGRRLMAASVHHLDHAIGEILESLEKTGKSGNTIVVFSSDNGGISNGHRGGAYPPPDPSLKPGYSSNGDLKGDKKHVYEGGIRVPAIVRWPGIATPAKISAPIHVCDWLPTLCAAATATDIPFNPDGENILPVLKGGHAEPRGFYWAWNGSQIPWDRQAVRIGDWKLVNEKKGEDEQWELYNLKMDPFEEKNLSGQHPERFRELMQFYRSQAAMDDDRWLPSIWIEGPQMFSAGESFVATLHGSMKMKIQRKDLEVKGGRISAIKRRGRDYRVKILPLDGADSIMLRVKGGSFMVGNGRMNQPSNSFICNVTRNTENISK